MKQRRVTMPDVAAKLGVSRIAVSTALRDHRRISIEWRGEIKRAAWEMGFVPVHSFQPWRHQSDLYFAD